MDDVPNVVNLAGIELYVIEPETGYLLALHQLECQFCKYYGPCYLRLELIEETGSIPAIECVNCGNTGYIESVFYRKQYEKKAE